MVVISTPSQLLPPCLSPPQKVLLLSMQIQVLVIFQGPVSSRLPVLIYSQHAFCAPP